MQLRPMLRLQSAIEAMTHIIIPALDKDDNLAQEQAQLVIGMLSNTLEWLPLEYAYDRAELTCLLDAADQVAGEQNETALDSNLNDVIGRARDVLVRSASHPSELLASVRELRSALGSSVTAAYQRGSAADQMVISRAVLDAAARHTTFVRSAYLGHGFEGSTPTVPPLAELLANTK